MKIKSSGILSDDISHTHLVQAGNSMSRHIAEELTFAVLKANKYENSRRSRNFLVESPKERVVHSISVWPPSTITISFGQTWCLENAND